MLSNFMFTIRNILDYEKYTTAIITKFNLKINLNLPINKKHYIRPKTLHFD